MQITKEGTCSLPQNKNELDRKLPAFATSLAAIFVSIGKKVLLTFFRCWIGAIPEFSKFSDKHGYNGHVLSKYAVDSVVTSIFNHRKAFIEAKMKCLCAVILKIDFNYKLASKVRVWTKQGHSFCPFKCIVTIQNEDGLTIFWKALKHSESFSEIKEDLISHPPKRKVEPELHCQACP
jgi:hypothetical protein